MTTIRRIFSSALFSILFVLTAATLSACKDDSAAQAQGQPPAGAMMGPKVSAAHPLEREVVAWEEFTGRFDAAARVELRARVSGYLDQIHFKDGQTVNQGDLLFTIDQRPFQSAVREAEAALNSAENAFTLANKELGRSQQLTKEGYASKQTLDTKVEGKQTAQANVNAARARLEQAKLDLEFTEIKAPIDGRISRHMVDTGNLVNGGAQGATLLTTLLALDPIHFYFDIDEQTYLKYSRLESREIRSGETGFSRPVELALSDSGRYEFSGTLDFVDTSMNTQTGTMRARATFDNSDYTLVPGMFGRVRIQGGEKKNAILIPDEAVGIDQTRNFVYALGENNMVVAKPVTLGPLVDGLRVIQTGLTTQDKVIVRGIQMLREGMPVTPEMIAIEAQQPTPELAPVPEAEAAPNAEAVPDATPETTPETTPDAMPEQDETPPQNTGETILPEPAPEQ